MAKFNPETNVDQGMDWTSASRGVLPNRSAATLLESGGDVALGAVAAVNQNSEETIKLDLQQSVDSLDNEWLGGASAFETEINSRNIQPLPEDLERYAENLQLNKAAYQAGTLRDSAYFLRVDSIARQMRARFPGHRDYIDKTLSELLGRSTAKDAIGALTAEWNAEQAQADDVTKFQRQWLKEKAGKVPRALYEDMITNGITEENFAQAQLEVQRIESEEATLQLSDARLNNLDKRKQLDVADVEETLAGEASQIALDTINQITSNTNLQAIDQWMANLKPGQVPDPEMVEKYTMALNQAKANVELAWNQRITKPWSGKAGDASYASKVSQDKLNQYKNIALSNINSLIEAINGPNANIAVAGAALRQSKLLTESGVADALTGEDKDFWRAWGISKELGASDWFLYYNTTANSGKGLEVQQRAYMNILGNALIDPKTESLEQATRKAAEASNGDMKASTSRAAVKDTVEALLHDENPEGQRVMAMKLFGEANNNYLNNFYQNPDSRMMIFELMTNPRMTQTMRDLGGQYPEVWQSYQRWVGQQFNTLFRDDAANVMDAQEFGDQLQVRWDPGTRQIIPGVAKDVSTAIGETAKISPIIGGPAAFMEWYKNSNARKSIERMNKYLKTVDSILQDADGTAHALSQLLIRTGIDFSAEKQGSILTRIYQALATPQEGEEAGRGDKGPDKLGSKPLDDIVSKQPNPDKQDEGTQEQIDLMELGEVINTSP